MSELDRRELGRALTKAADASVHEVLAAGLAPAPSSMRRIAFTGAPGAGKSTLTGLFARTRLAARPEARIGILAVDPTSRYSGGAVLGDRIRMDVLVGDPNIFIRSLASRGGAEGLADNMGLVFTTLERFGFDEAIMETVGAGQTDCAVRELADVVVLVTNPESGDTIQAMKSGIMEAADIYVVNKADLPGASQAVSFLRSGLNGRTRNGLPPLIIETSHSDPASVEHLSQAVDLHLTRRSETVDAQTVQRNRAAHVLEGLVRRRAAEILSQSHGEAATATLSRLSDAFSMMARAVSDG